VNTQKTFEVIALLAVAVLAGCGGGGGSGSGAGSTPASTVNVQTYFRDPSVAFNNSVTNTNTTPVPSVVLPNNGSTDFVNLNIEVANYQSTIYPLTANDNLANIQIGLYRTANVTRKPNIIKGIVPHDAGGWLNNIYSAGYFSTTWDRIKNKTNANTVVYADSAFITAFDVQNNVVNFAGTFFPNNSMVLDMANMSKNRNMDLMMMIGIYPGDSFVQSFYQQIFTIPASNTQFWDAWFSSYKNILIERATLAKSVGITRLAIGFNMDYMVDKGNARWADLISAIRATGFAGKISYYAGTSRATNAFSGMSESSKNSFIQLFDEIGLTAYDAIIPSATSDLLQSAESIDQMKNFFRTQINSVASANIPVVFLLGTPSINGGTITTDYVEPGTQCISTQITNYQQQADAYEAVSEVLNETTANVGGILSWGYGYRDNLTTLFTNNDTCFKNSASIRGKAAEAVLKYWFTAW
jgi:hypothetical protein